MPNPKPTPSAAYLHECLDYNPATGVLTWKHRPQKHFRNARVCSMWNSTWPGTVAGHVRTDGRLVVCIDQINYKAHRIIWRWMTSDEPPQTLDHIDGNPLNNRWTNIRVATVAEQNWNRGLQKSNATGIRGITPTWNKWRARIMIDGNHRSLGLFSTREEASAAYERAARELFGEFYRAKR